MPVEPMYMPGPQPDRLEAFEHGDVLGRVTGLCLGLRHKGENACKTRVLRGTESVSDRAGAAPLCKPQTDRFLHTFAQLFVSDRGGDRPRPLLVLRRGLDRASKRPLRRPTASGPGAKRSRGTSQPAARRRSAISAARWPSSKAQTESAVCTCTVPSREMRAGQALRAIAAPTTLRPALDELGHAGLRAEAAKLGADLATERIHAPPPRAARARSAARTRASR